VATVDIPGAFMQANMDELVHMRLDGQMAELMTQIDPVTYMKYTIMTQGKSVLYVCLKRSSLRHSASSPSILATFVQGADNLGLCD
jgi:hypothetical protein